MLGCGIYESCTPTLLFGLCTELTGMALPFVVIQADRRRGVSSKKVVFVVFSGIEEVFLFSSDKMSDVLLIIIR